MAIETKSTLHNSTLNTLRELLQANTDSAKGFDEVAGIVSDPALQCSLKQRADERRTHIGELADLLTLNHQPTSEDGSWLAAYHRTWIAIKATVSSGDHEAMLTEVERGEKHLADRYVSLLLESPGSAVSDVLHRQYARVKNSLGQIDIDRQTLDKDPS